MSRSHVLVSVALAVGLGGCAKHHAPETLPTTAGRTSVPIPTLTSGQIVDVLLRLHSTQITEGSLVAAKTSDANVREFANRMINDHAEARKEIEVLAQKRGIERESSRFSQSIDDGRYREIAEIQRRSGRDLDRQYIAHETEEHRELVNTIDRDLLPRTNDGQLRRALTKTRRLLENHLEHARRVEEELGR